MFTDEHQVSAHQDCRTGPQSRPARRHRRHPGYLGQREHPAPAVTQASATHATTVRGITFQGHVEDTTDHATSVLDPSYGYVWSYDDMSPLAQRGQGRGRPDAVACHAQPALACTTPSLIRARTTWPTTAPAAVAGWVTYDVRSATAPSQAQLPLTVPSTMHSTDIIAKWFGNPAGVPVTTLHYDFNYYGLPGGVYNQQG